MQHVDAVDRCDHVGVPDRFRRFEHRDQQGFLVEIAVDLTLGACRVAERRPGARGRTVAVRRVAAALDDGLGHGADMRDHHPLRPQSRIRVASCASRELTRAIGVMPIPSAATQIAAAVSSEVGLCSRSI